MRKLILNITKIEPEMKNFSDESYENIASMMRAQGISCTGIYS